MVGQILQLYVSDVDLAPNVFSFVLQNAPEILFLVMRMHFVWTTTERSLALVTPDTMEMVYLALT